MTIDLSARWLRVGAAILIAPLLLCCDRKPNSGGGSGASGAAPAAGVPAAGVPGGTKPHAYGSNLELVDCQMIAGWAWDASNPNTPTRVDVYDGNTLLGTAVAGIFRKDLVDANKGDGRHGFKFPVPPALKDGEPHTIKVSISGTTLQLANSPKTLVCPDPGAGTGNSPGSDPSPSASPDTGPS
jgi:hypothetical protein